MTTDDMYDRMLTVMNHYRSGVSFAELSRAVGEEGRGEMAIHFPDRPNTILWAGCNEQFAEAYLRLMKVCEPSPTSFLTYLADGHCLRLPIVKTFRKKDYKKEHWLPLAFRLRSKPDR